MGRNTKLQTNKPKGLALIMHLHIKFNVYVTWLGIHDCLHNG